MDAIRTILERFGPISEEEWQAYQSISKRKEVPKDAFLIRQGEVCRETYYIKKGLARLYHLKDGEEKIRQFFFEGSFLTDVASFTTGRPSLLYLQVLEDSQLLVIPRDSLHALYESSMNLQRLGRMIAEYNSIGIANRMDSLFLYSAEERYLNLINNRPRVSQRIPQYMIASYLGVTPEGLSRIKRRVAKQERS